MATLYFTHKHTSKALGDLVIKTGANSIEWGYGLNTQVIPTYGGEVVQILSTYVDDLSIEGEVRTYAEGERIYKWFLHYMQTATQGQQPNSVRFQETPVVMSYPERGWRLKLRPHTLPGFRQGTEVVAPAWQLQAAVVEEDPKMNALTMAEATKRGFDFSTLHGGIGYDEDNPFTDAGAKDAYDPKEFTGKITDFYQNLIPSYLEGDLDVLFKNDFLGSGPTQEDTKKSDKDKDGGKKTETNEKTPSRDVIKALGDIFGGG